MNYNETEKRYISIIESNLKHFNTGRRKRLDVHFYIAGGNRALVLFGGSTVAADLTIQETYYFVFGFIQGRKNK